MSDLNPAVLTATEKTKTALGKASPWMLFLAVMAYIGCGVLALAGVVLALVGGALSSLGGMGELREIGRWIWPALGLFYIGMAALAFFPAFILQRTARHAKLFGTGGAPNDLEGVAVGVHSLARYWGICTIVLLGTYVLAVIGLIVAMAVAWRYF